MTTEDFPYPLVSTDWLTTRLADPDLRIVDGSWRMPGNPPAITDHQQRRIPGAVYFDLDLIADRSTTLPHMLTTPALFAEAAGALGIGADDRVIVYDDQGIFSAARVWWTFRAFGHEKVSVLDGGLPQWLREGRDVVSGREAPAARAYGEARTPVLSRTAAQVRDFLTRPAGVVLDARPAARFRGEAPEPRPGLRRGHMPGAVNLPHGALLTDSGMMRPLSDLARLFHDRDVHAGTDVILSCGSGVTAAVLALALERLGHRRHALYDGSWSEWGALTNDPALFPAATE